MSVVTDAAINAWLARQRGMKCTPHDELRQQQLCRGEHVMYTDKRTGVEHTVTVVSIGPIVPNGSGAAEPSSVTVRFEDGHERNTTMRHLSFQK